MENNGSEVLFVNKVQSLRLSNYIYIHFALEKGIAKTVIFKKKHAEILRFIFKDFLFLIMCKEKCGVSKNKSS